eukprot:GHVH01001095.1.p1 GENE.GHVH01001095.1~~GHVH01001095.1.p1  ORF type:complete len:165 (+),score=30.37 GHVH01001095.1:132-626(+)
MGKTFKDQKWTPPAEDKHSRKLRLAAEREEANGVLADMYWEEVETTDKKQMKKNERDRKKADKDASKDIKLLQRVAREKDANNELENLIKDKPCKKRTLFDQNQTREAQAAIAKTASEFHSPRKTVKVDYMDYINTNSDGNTARNVDGAIDLLERSNKNTKHKR